MSDDDDELLLAVLEAEERKALADNSNKHGRAYESTPSTGTYLKAVCLCRYALWKDCCKLMSFKLS